MFYGIRERLLNEIDAFCSEHGIPAWRFGTLFAGDNKFYARIQAGENVGIYRLETVAARAAAYAEAQASGADDDVLAFVASSRNVRGVQCARTMRKAA
jgi:hypothetical protein